MKTIERKSFRLRGTGPGFRLGASYSRTTVKSAEPGESRDSRPFTLGAAEVFAICKEMGTTDCCGWCPDKLRRACAGEEPLTIDWIGD